MKQLFLLTFAVGLMACGGGSKSDTAATANPCAANPCGDSNPCEANPCDSNPCEANPCGGAASTAGIDWSGWQSWAKVNNDTFVSKGHKKPWVNVYVTDAEAYKAGGEMKEGFAAVKTIHEDVDGQAGPVKMLTVMAKMGSDYDPDNGNWYYAAMSADGSKVMNEGKLPMCMGCHTGGDDYLFQGKVVGK